MRMSESLGRHLRSRSRCAYFVHTSLNSGDAAIHAGPGVFSFFCGPYAPLVRKSFGLIGYPFLCLS